MTIILFVFATLVLFHLSNAVYVIAHVLIGHAVGAAVERAQIGMNIFVKPWVFYWGLTEVQIGVFPIFASTKYFGGDGEADNECRESQRVSDLGELPKRFDELGNMGRFLIMMSGPCSSLALGIVLLLLPVYLNGPQVNVGGPTETMLSIASVPNLGIDDERASFAGQQSLIRHTIIDFWSRALTGKPMTGWGGPIAWIVTCGCAGVNSPLAWLSCVSLLLITNGAFNLLPIPSLNGGRAVLVAWESIFGPLKEQVQMRMILAGVLLVIGIFIYTLVLDVRWFWERFAM